MTPTPMTPEEEAREIVALAAPDEMTLVTARILVDAIAAALRARAADMTRLRLAEEEADRLSKAALRAQDLYNVAQSNAAFLAEQLVKQTEALESRLTAAEKVVKAAITLRDESPVGDNDRPYVSDVAFREFNELMLAVDAYTASVKKGDAR